MSVKQFNALFSKALVRKVGTGQKALWVLDHCPYILETFRPKKINVPLWHRYDKCHRSFHNLESSAPSEI